MWGENLYKGRRMGLEGGKMTKVDVKLPEEIAERLGVKGKSLWWTYWTAAGDEAMVGYVVERIRGYVEFDSDWDAYLALLRLNPHLERYKLGSSDEEAEYYLLFKGGEFYIATPEEVYDLALS